MNHQLNDHSKVLLAESHIDDSQFIRTILEQMGLTVTCVDNGEKAVEKALLEDFDLILMNMDMPIMTGVEALAMIRSTDQLVPVVALTTNTMPQAVSHYSQLGFTAHLNKPIEQSHLTNIITQYCKNSSTQATPTLDDEDTLFSLQDSAFKTLIAEYIDSLPCEIEMLHHAKAANDWSKLAKVTHNLKGSAGNFGFTQVSTHAATLETILKADRLSEVDTVFNALIEALNNALYANEYS